jgi:SWI/SNF-related matrix-associated actin-dependent regulator of chromatin subfamily A3
VHRLGQTRETRVFRLIMKDSIEDRVMDIQRRKRELMMVAFAERQGKRGKETSVADIERLLA